MLYFATLNSGVFVGFFLFFWFLHLKIYPLKLAFIVDTYFIKVENVVHALPSSSVTFGSTARNSFIAFLFVLVASPIVEGFGNLLQSLKPPNLPQLG